MTSRPSESAHGASAFDRERVRREIVAAALPHVPFDGWSQTALRQAAIDAGYAATMPLRVFPGGPVEVVDFWCAESDRAMVAAIERQNGAAMKVRERVALGVRLRLEPLTPQRESVRRALGLLALPFNAGVALKTLWRTVDAIWYAAGDTATDFNFYTKRGLLAGVYGATVAYWLDDKSEGQADTWAFLERRIADTMRLPQALGEFQKRLKDLPNPFQFFAAPRR